MKKPKTLVGFLKGIIESTPHKKDDAEAKKDSDAEVPVEEHETGAEPGINKVSGWRPAESILKLREQVNIAAPHRSKASDGIIGDENHKNNKSDHNPWVIKDGVGVVTAIDITHDPARDCDAGLLAEAIVASQDSRVKYVIWNRRIANFQAIGGQPAWTWRPYNGANPHDKHVHISVREQEKFYDSVAKWKLWKGAEANAAGGDALDLSGNFDEPDKIAWGRRVPAAFRKKVIQVANRLQMDPSVLMAVMAFETGREFKSSTKNKVSGAIGLIQFMPKTAENLGTSSAKLAAMSEIDQLDFVETYLRPFTGKMIDVASAYMAVLWPAAVPSPLSHVLFEAPTKAYAQNKGLDADDDGKVTKAEASAKVAQQLVEGMRPENFG